MYLYKTWMCEVPSLTIHPNSCCKVFLSLSSETLVHWGTRRMNWLFTSSWHNSSRGLMGFMCFDWVLRPLENLQGERRSLKWCLQLDNLLGRQSWQNQRLCLLEGGPAHPRSHVTPSLVWGPAGQLCWACFFRTSPAEAALLMQWLIQSSASAWCPHATHPPSSSSSCALCNKTMSLLPTTYGLQDHGSNVELLCCQPNTCASHIETS